jgi:hypothetical protein
LIDAETINLPMLDRMYKEYPKGHAPDTLEQLARKILDADGFVFGDRELFGRAFVRCARSNRLARDTCKGAVELRQIALTHRPTRGWSRWCGPHQYGPSSSRQNWPTVGCLAECRGAFFKVPHATCSALERIQVRQSPKSWCASNGLHRTGAAIATRRPRCSCSTFLAHDTTSSSLNRP